MLQIMASSINRYVAIPSNRVKDSYPCLFSARTGAGSRGQKRGSRGGYPPHPGGHPGQNHTLSNDSSKLALRVSFLPHLRKSST